MIQLPKSILYLYLLLFVNFSIVKYSGEESIFSAASLSYLNYYAIMFYSVP